jgi:hypothetical protein
LKILEDHDNIELVDNDTLRDICYLIEEFNYDNSVVRIVKAVYKEILRRSSIMTLEEL